jgi:hypothetical protein
MDVVVESYEELIAHKLEVIQGRVFAPSKMKDIAELPISATPSNIADVSTMVAISLAIDKPRRGDARLPEVFQVAKSYWHLGGGRVDRNGPGHGSWKNIIDHFDNSNLYHRELANMILELQASPMPLALKESILNAAKLLIRSLS